MKKLFFLITTFVSFFALTGCMLMLFDEEVDKIQIKSRELYEFDGWYTNKASYISKSKSGVSIMGELVDYIHFSHYVSGIDYVNLSIDSNENIIFTSVINKKIFRPKNIH